MHNMAGKANGEEGEMSKGLSESRRSRYWYFRQSDDANEKMIGWNFCVLDRSESDICRIRCDSENVALHTVKILNEARHD